MSGPKRSTWELRQSERDRLRRERQQNHIRQVREIKQSLADIEHRLGVLRKEHSQYAEHTLQRVEDWIGNARLALNVNLRDAWRGLHGIQNYVATQEIRLRQKAQAAQRKQQRLRGQREEARRELGDMTRKLDALEDELGSQADALLRGPRQWLQEAEQQSLNKPQQVESSLRGIAQYLQMHQENIEDLRQTAVRHAKAQHIIGDLEAMATDSGDIMNPAIEQRIDLFCKAIASNPDNPNTLAQITAFKKQVSDLAAEHEEKQAGLAIIQQALSQTLGAEPREGEQGGVVIAGDIDGVPIAARINPNNHDIHLDTPSDGSCRQAMDTLQQRLGLQGVGLGPIKILNTGDVIGHRSQHASKQSIDA